MRLAVALIVAVALAGSAPVQAQEVELPKRQIVDSRGVLVGELVGLSPMATVLLRVDGKIFQLYLERRHRFRSLSSVAFETADCSGPMYVAIGRGRGLLEHVVVLDDFRVYVADEAAAARFVQIRSTLDDLGRCEAQNGARQNAKPATLLIDLSVHWTPPFRIR